MPDIKVLDILATIRDNVKKLPEPPDKYEELFAYEDEVEKEVELMGKGLTDIGNYLKEMEAAIERVSVSVQEHKIIIREKVKKLVGRLTYTPVGEMKPEVDKDILDYVARLQKLEKKKARLLEKSILQAVELAFKLEKNKASVIMDVHEMTNCVGQWTQEEDEYRKERKELTKTVSDKIGVDDINEEATKKENETDEDVDKENRDLLTYTRFEDTANTFHQGFCCILSVAPGSVDSSDFKCDILGDILDYKEDFYDFLQLGESVVSSVILVEHISLKQIKGPIEVYLPRCHIPPGIGELAVNASLDGGEWTQYEPIFSNKLTEQHEDVTFVGARFNSFKKLRVVIINTPATERISVDQDQLNYVSTVDNRVTLLVPKYSFPHNTNVKLQAFRVEDEKLRWLIRNMRSCKKVLTSSSIVTVTMKKPAEKTCHIDLYRESDSGKRLQSGRFFQLYQDHEDCPWRFATGVRERSDGKVITIEIPTTISNWIRILELEMLTSCSRTEVVEAAEAIFSHCDEPIVRLLVRQGDVEPEKAMVCCCAREKLSQQMRKYEELNYSRGPSCNKEFLIREGQVIHIRTKGNIGLIEHGDIPLKMRYHSHLEECRSSLELHVLDEDKQGTQKDYMGILVFDITATKGLGNRDSSVQVPIHLPKHRKLVSRAQVILPHHVSALIKYISMRLSDADISIWNMLVKDLGKEAPEELESILRRARVEHRGDNDKIFYKTVLENWFKQSRNRIDKGELLTDSLGRIKEAEFQRRGKHVLKIHRDFLNEEQLRHFSSLIGSDWEALARNLGLPREDIEACRIRVGDQLAMMNTHARQASNMLIKWRISDDAIDGGDEVLNAFLTAVKKLPERNKTLEELLKIYIDAMKQEM